MTKPKIVLAYSGGLDTTVAVPWLQETYDADIITLTVDLGMVDLESIRQRALSIGAMEALTVDGKDTLVNEFLFPSVVLVTALLLPLLAHFGVMSRMPFLVHPVEPPLALMRAAYQPAGGPELAYAVAGTLAWVAVSYVWARRQFVRFIVRAAGT